MLKKILLGMTMVSSLSMASEGVNLYFRAGADINGKFDTFKDNGAEVNKKDADKIGYEIASEITKEVLPNFELGLGLAYQNHNRAEKEISRFGDVSLYFDTPEVTSIPIYLTSKYTFITNSTLKPYIKADLGYSFNDLKGNFAYNCFGDKKYEAQKEYDTEIKDGVYFGIGGGIEYYNFTMDLMYKINKAELSYGVENKKITKDFDYSRVTLSMGYKFDF